MRLVLATLPIFIPVLFWAGYHYYKDRHQPEPVLNLVFCFLLGIGASYLAKFMYASLDLIGMRFDPYELAANNLWHMFAYAVLVIGGIEETAKLLPFLIFAIRFDAFDENLDGIEERIASFLRSLNLRDRYYQGHKVIPEIEAEKIFDEYERVVGVMDNLLVH